MPFVFPSNCDGALLSWGWLNPCPLVGRITWILTLLCLCTKLLLSPIRWSLTQHVTFLTLILLNLSSISLAGTEGAAAVGLSCLMGLNQDNAPQKQRMQEFGKQLKGCLRAGRHWEHHAFNPSQLERCSLLYPENCLDLMLLKISTCTFEFRHRKFKTAPQTRPKRSSKTVWQHAVSRIFTPPKQGNK